MWVTVLLGVFVVSMIVGPILLLSPTKSQRQQEALRNQARKSGLRVHLQVPPEGTQWDSNQNAMPIYCLPWKDPAKRQAVWSLVKTAYSHDINFYQQWDWATKPDQLSASSINLLRDAFQQPPQHMQAFLVGPQGIGAYWNERGGEEELQAIIEWLQAVKAAVPELSEAGLN